MLRRGRGNLSLFSTALYVGDRQAPAGGAALSRDDLLDTVPTEGQQVTAVVAVACTQVQLAVTSLAIAW